MLAKIEFHYKIMLSSTFPIQKIDGVNNGFNKTMGIFE